MTNKNAIMFDYPIYETKRMKTESLNNNSNSLVKSNNYSWRGLVQSSKLEARKLIAYDFAIKYKILPIDVINYQNNPELLIAVLAGTNKVELTSILNFLTNLKVTLIECDETPLIKAISSAYFVNLEDLVSDRTKNYDQSLKESCTLKITPSTDKDQIIPEILINILNFSFSNFVSDIHLESGKEGIAKISFRSKGDLKTNKNLTLDKYTYESLGRYIKILCSLDITEHKCPQEGMFETQFHESNIRIRVSIIPSLYGSKIALRILHHYLLDELENKKEKRLKYFGLNTEQEKLIKETIIKKNGLILVSGPTGSGKSTLLYSIVEDICPKNWNILSLEDPVEREISKITQIEVNSEDKFAFQKSLKSLLRQDPDMLVISEIRDREVLFTAIQAALSGILVISTIHAANTLELILRLFELGCTPVTLGSVLKFTSSQRLIPKNCQHCLTIAKTNSTINKNFFIENATHLFESKGCNECEYEMKSGLVAVYETCIPTLEQITQLYSFFKEGLYINKNFSNESLNKSHFHSFNQSIRDYLTQGIISPNTALSFCNK
jgi:type II secretory ATPase GspE/PulE/Tfp pilus assembly ATPase PilB-like protein